MATWPNSEKKENISMPILLALLHWNSNSERDSRSDALKFSIVEHTAVIRFCINKLIVVWARSKCLGCEKLICLELKTTSIITHWLKSNAWDPKMDISRSSFHKDTGTLRCSHKPNKLCDNPIIFKKYYKHVKFPHNISISWNKLSCLHEFFHCKLS